MLQIHAEDILGTDNASDLYMLLRSLPSSIHQADRLINASYLIQLGLKAVLAERMIAGGL